MHRRARRHMLSPTSTRWTIGLLVLCMCLGMFSACKRKSAAEMLQLAENEFGKAEQTADSVRGAGGAMTTHFKPAIDAYNDIIDRYPGTQEAERAYGMVASIRQNFTHEPELAVAAYKQYREAFPNGRQAGLALFLIGYLYNNEIHNTDSAAVAYKKFLELYPQHEMAQSAQFELQNLGKTPDELLPHEGQEGEPAPPEHETAQKSPHPSKTL